MGSRATQEAAKSDRAPGVRRTSRTPPASCAREAAPTDSVTTESRRRRGASVLDDLAGPAGGLDGLAGGGAELVRVDRERLGELALREDLHRDALLRAQPVGVQRVERHRVAGLEARLEVRDVEDLRVRPERLEGHRLLHVRAAQLAHPHVDRHLAALEVRARLRARARAVALLAAAGRLAGARALAAADALARLAAVRGGLEGVQPEVVALLSHRSSPGGGRGAACRAPAGCP